MRVISVSESRHVAGARLLTLLTEQEVDTIPVAIATMNQYLRSQSTASIINQYQTDGVAGVLASATAYGASSAGVGIAAYQASMHADEVTDHWLLDTFRSVIETVIESPPVTVDWTNEPETQEFMQGLETDWLSYWQEVPVADPYYDNYYDQNWVQYYDSYDNYYNDYYGDSYYDSY